ncbi:MAG: hypothetical protein DI537_23585 [Stutzerimonas stutzeri]|nr:MAG: hypothetical protein DI537_23585 [Stutzerimonas stutzeri]
MRVQIVTLVLMATGLAGVAQAAVPVNDGAILDRRTDESAKKVEIKLMTGKTQTYTRGINCSVTKPKKDNAVTSPTQKPDAGRGAATLDKADPTIRTSPAFTKPTTTWSSGKEPQGAADWTAGPRADREGTSQVLGGMETVQASIQPNRQVFERMGREVGSDGTLMEALDRNSAIRTQTGLTFNQAIHGVSFLSQAFNLPNLATASMTSQGTRGIALPASSGGQARPLQTISLCPAGMTGEGTAASPCVAAGCSTTPYGTTPAPGCVARRYNDTAGNVSFAIEREAARANAAQQPLSSEELMAAVRQYQSR